MYRTRKDFAFKDVHTPSSMVSMSGLFQNGVWHCDCQPRLPASRLQVRKLSPNKGRWFFTCQKAKETSCDFFHWDLSAASTETKSNLLAQPSTASHTVPLDKWKVEGHIGASNEQMKDFKREEEGGFSKWPLAVKGEASALDAFRRSTSASPCPETPHRSINLDTSAVSTKKRKRIEVEWPTPVTPTKFPSTTRPHSFFDARNCVTSSSLPLSPPTTLTLARFHDFTSTGEDYEITTEVMDILKDVDLQEDTVMKLRQTLNLHALRSLGISRGRDITRVALKSKETKIVELQKRIIELETELGEGKNRVSASRATSQSIYSGCGSIRGPRAMLEETKF